MQKTTFNVSEVHRLTGKARSTINNHIRKGLISCVLDSQGGKAIEASELTRVYGDYLDVDEDGVKPKAAHAKASAQMPENTDLKLLEREQKERERERRQLEDTIIHLRSDLEKSMERESRATLLLEHQTKNSDQWERRFEDFEKRILEQEREVEKYRKALIKERKKTLWQKLIGR